MVRGGGGKALEGRDEGSIPLVRGDSKHSNETQSPAAAAGSDLGEGGHRGLRQRPRPSTGPHSSHSFFVKKIHSCFENFTLFVCLFRKFLLFSKKNSLTHHPNHAKPGMQEK